MNEPTHESSSQASRESQTSASPDDELLAAVADEFAARLRRGDHPTVEEYATKHPALAERIRKVLAAVSMMEQTRNWEAAASGGDVGEMAGRYKLLERIGEGGFGVVFMAEQQEPVRRKVALKVIKPGMDTRQVIARFEAERQALAIMDHPNIARVLDAGATDSGRPYFVMELIKGVSITEYCDQRQLAPRERLELFADVCHAVQHAHQKGIIHRDIKPSNVLVMSHDSKPVVKVIDFGVAKALGQELTDKTLFTGFAQLVGTPLYMSPEQAGESSLDVDTRSDIYSLGVLLYELLTGTTPFDKERFKQAVHDEIRRIIREEDPPKPSTRLSESKDTLPSISAQRHTDPDKLTKLVRGELDWIVMKALEKDRSRRYETANAFTADVLRYLADEPVLACPPSAVYQMKKFARRNKAKLSMGLVVGAALLSAVGSIGWMVRDQTARQAKVAGQVELILAEVDKLEREQMWPEALSAVRRAQTAVTSGEADAASARRVHERLRDLEFIDRLEQIRMERATWADGKFDHVGTERAYARAFRDYGVDVVVLPVQTSISGLKRRPSLAIPLATALDDWVSNSSGDIVDWNRLRDITRGIDSDPLRSRFRTGPESLSLGELARLAESIDVKAHPPTTLDQMAGTLIRGNEHSESGLGLLRAAQAAYPGDFWLNYNLGCVLAEQQDYEGAIRFSTAAVALRPQAVAAQYSLGFTLQELQRPDEAYAAYRKAIDIDPKFAWAHFGLGNVLKDQGKIGEAVAEYRKTIEIDPTYARAYGNLGIALRELKRPEEAIAASRKAAELDPNVASFHRNLGSVLCDDLGEYDAAIECFHKAIKLEPNYINGYQCLAVALGKQHKTGEQIAALEKMLELDPGNAYACERLASRLAIYADEKLRDPKRAVDLAKKAVELDPSARTWQTLGWSLYRSGDWPGCIAALDKSMQLEKGGDPGQWFFLAMAHQHLGHLDEARQWHDRAVEWKEKNNANDYLFNKFHQEAAELLGVAE